MVRDTEQSQELIEQPAETAGSEFGLAEDCQDQAEYVMGQDPEVPPIDESPDPAFRRVIRELRDWVLIIVVALALGLFLRNYVIQRNLVDGSSMFPTLHDTDRVLVEMLTLHFGHLNRGDIVTVDTAGLPTYEWYDEADLEAPRIIKRIIGLPGDHLEIKQDGVYLNGQAIVETYVRPGARTKPDNPEYADLVLGPDMYFVMGDNRDGSKDSRHFGPVKIDHIVGKLWIRVYPYNQIGSVE